MAGPAGPDHVGFPYRGVAEYVSGTLAFVHTALTAGQPVLVAVPSAKLEILRDCLGSRGSRVHFADMAVEGRNPGRILPGVLLAFADRHPGRRVAIVAEPVWPGRGELEYPACVAHEALVNLAFAGRDAALLCPYDAALLDPHVVHDAHRTHPFLQRRGGLRPSPVYADPRLTAADCNQPLPPVPGYAATMGFAAPDQVPELLAFVAERADALGLKPRLQDALTAAVAELAADALACDGQPGRIAVWAEHDQVLCQLDDTGHRTDPLAGRVPSTRAEDGRAGDGLLTANLLCDLVRLYTRPGGTSVRLHLTAG
ncbi:anti-sigma factor RsbA family regulatory protein [Catellatospora bangladeshensis]|uniref:Anti-sigma regulatory factor n=1 Tax=Catellatospora bangladeshensis TaxID=310355 RepID=A0A8J3NJ73_9ACTN|nr:sensor histidine kinase [Catellatospora bangladeshensis]GIF83170.1 anti-sigma regulatory factor [Catellatospora bangladeshensis]